MLPYLQQQLAYAGATSLIVLLVWRATRKMAARPIRRLLVCSFGLAGALVAAALLSGFGAGAANVSGFLLIAFGYYAFGIVLPILALFQLKRSRLAPLAALGVLAVTGWASFVEPNRLEARRDRVVLDRLATGPTIRIAHVSDLQTVGHCAREDEAARLVNEFEPDLIVFSGDYVAGPFEDPEPGIAAARSFIAKLKARLGIVVVDGHAEPTRVRERVFAGFDLVYLKDREQVFELGDGRRLRVFGMNVHDANLDLIRPAEGPREIGIVVSHMPDPSVDLSGRGVDLHFAGHTHGGQISLPFVGPPITLSSLPRSQARGLHRVGDHWLNVSAGIGMEGNHAPRLRFNCPPEISLIEIEGRGEKIER